MYAILKMGYTPLQWINLTYKEKAFIMACIEIEMDEKKKNAQKMKANKPATRRR